MPDMMHYLNKKAFNLPDDMSIIPRYIECNCCGCYHRIDFYGDCRSNEDRFFADELDEKYGVDGWIEVCEEEQ